jgi:hypothetical protein
MVVSVVSLEKWLHEALEKSCQRSLLLGKWGLDCQAWLSVLQQTAALYTREHDGCLHLAAWLHRCITHAYMCHCSPSACVRLRYLLRRHVSAPCPLVAASRRCGLASVRRVAFRLCCRLAGPRRCAFRSCHDLMSRHVGFGRGSGTRGAAVECMSQRCVWSRK